MRNWEELISIALISFGQVDDHNTVVQCIIPYREFPERNSRYIFFYLPSEILIFEIDWLSRMY